jgi:hypothetical protein
MAFPNVTDIVTTTLENRSKKIADNVTENNALLLWLSKRGNIRTFGGGRLIYEEISFAENGNANSYSGYETLPTAAADVLSAAEFAIKQYACPVIISGLEMLMNSGEEAVIDLIGQRIKVAEASMKNRICADLYGDGTGNGSKNVTGLDAAVPVTPSSGTYGGIDRSAYSFWQSYVLDTNAVPAAATIQGHMNTAWSNLVRGGDRPKLILAEGTAWAAYMASLQTLQRFTSADQAGVGFPSIKFMDADVVLDGGIGGNATTGTMYFLNTDHLFFRPHKDRNMVPISPTKRVATNQDAEVQILGWAGNLTCSNSKLQGRLIMS